MLSAVALILLSSSGDCCASMKELARDPAFVALHLAPNKIQFKPQFGRMKRLASGTAFTNAFVVPPSAKSDVGIVMIHEWWGLNDHIKREAEKLHQATGYGVVALDLYGGKVADKPDEAVKLMQGVDADTAKAIVTFVPREIRTGQVFGRKLSRVGTVGYCFGGGWSLQTAILGGTAVDACVMYYGMPEQEPDALKNLRAPVLGIFGSLDKNLNPDVVGRFARAMAMATKRLDLRVYPADHAFANPSNPHYDKPNAERAWSEMLAFFARYLK